LKFEPTNINGVQVIHQFNATDERGTFIKTFHELSFKEAGIDFELKESFYSTSMRGVVRGMHFHLPPHEHSKIVYCVRGVVLDCALDLRKESETYGQYVTRELSDNNFEALFIPKGCAHGFASLSKQSTLMYLVSGAYSVEHDGGVLYNSFDLEWPVEQAIISPRDLSFPELNQFNSPF